MKKITTLCAAMAISAVSFAQDITVLVNGSPGGTFFVRSNLYAEGLASLGYNVSVVDAKKNSAAAQQFINTDQPTVMVWISPLAAKRPVEATEDNFIATEYTAPLMLCAITGNQSGTIGAPGMYVMDPVLEMIPDATVIPYKNTGATLNAGLAGEIDFAYLNMGKAEKLVDAGYSCEPVPGVAQIATLLGTNVDIEQLRKVIVNIQQSPKFAEWLTEQKFNTDVRDTRDAEVEAVNTSEEQWKSASN